MTQEHPEQPKKVPIGELKELVEEWRAFADSDGWDGYSRGVNEASESCANELEEVLERYE